MGRVRKTTSLLYQISILENSTWINKLFNSNSVTIYSVSKFSKITSTLSFELIWNIAGGKSYYVPWNCKNKHGYLITR